MRGLDAGHKLHIMRKAASTFSLLALIILFASAAFLYGQNRKIKAANRQLMLQNDSIMSVNLELNKQFHEQESQESKHLKK